MLTAFLNTLKVKELRNRLLFTALIIVLVRFASNIPCPGVDPAALEKFISEVSAGSSSSGGFMALIDLFSGGALAHFALGALGIMPLCFCFFHRIQVLTLNIFNQRDFHNFLR